MGVEAIAIQHESKILVFLERPIPVYVSCSKLKHDIS